MSKNTSNLFKRHLRSTVHIGRSETNGIVELGVVFFGVPIGGSPRIDQPQPADCPIT